MIGTLFIAMTLRITTFTLLTSILLKHSKMTFSITTFAKMALSIRTFTTMKIRITPLTIILLCITPFHQNSINIHHNDTQHIGICHIDSQYKDIRVEVFSKIARIVSPIPKQKISIANNKITDALLILRIGSTTIPKITRYLTILNVIRFFKDRFIIKSN